MAAIRLWRSPSSLSWLFSASSFIFLRPNPPSPSSPSECPSSLSSLSPIISPILILSSPFRSLVFSSLSSSSSEPLLDVEVPGEDASSFWLSREVQGVDAGCVELEWRTTTTSDKESCSEDPFEREGRVKDDGGNNTAFLSSLFVCFVWPSAWMTDVWTGFVAFSLIPCCLLLVTAFVESEKNQRLHSAVGLIVHFLRQISRFPDWFITMEESCFYWLIDWL